MWPEGPRSEWSWSFMPSRWRDHEGLANVVPARCGMAGRPDACVGRNDNWGCKSLACGEMPVPAYEAMKENGMSERRQDVLMRGVSMRQDAELPPEKAATCGVSKSNASREATDAGEVALQERLERQCDAIDLLDLHRRQGVRRVSRDQRGGCRSSGTHACASHVARSDGKRRRGRRPACAVGSAGVDPSRNACS